MVKFVKAFDIRQYIEKLKDEQFSSEPHLTEAAQKELSERFELYESLLSRATPLLERSKRIISSQAPGIPHTIETSLENLRIEIDETITKMIDA